MVMDVVGLGIIGCALVYGAFKYEQLQKENAAKVDENNDIIRLAAEAGMKLVLENIELNNTIDMLAEAEVAALYPKEVNE